jgi:hypothetical protein
MSWNLKGSYVETCSCELMCPCNVSFDHGATYDYCPAPRPRSWPTISGRRCDGARSRSIGRGGGSPASLGGRTPEDLFGSPKGAFGSKRGAIVRPRPALAKVCCP